LRADCRWLRPAGSPRRGEALNMSDSTRERESMVRTHIAARGIRDESVLDAFRSVPREAGPQRSCHGAETGDRDADFCKDLECLEHSAAPRAPQNYQWTARDGMKRAVWVQDAREPGAGSPSARTRLALDSAGTR
jgi:hypothetical protein